MMTLHERTRRHKSFGWAVAVGLALSTLMLGCTAARDHPAAMHSATAKLSEIPSIAFDPQSATGDKTRILPASARKSSHALVLSSGGVNGAFPAGVLVGWSESGTRPSFDTVTGVSVGALLATYAFLGAEYDTELERQYATLDATRIYRRRAYVTLPWADALADSKPLRHQIACAITADVLERVAQEYRKGRRLYVGTTNVDTQRLVVWDMGAIAAGTDPDKLDLFRTVLLASCSVPAFLPPVPINIEVDGEQYTELHTDGSVSASLFLLPQMIRGDNVAAGRRLVAKPAIHVLIAGKLAPNASPISRRLISVADSSLRGMMHAQMENDLQRLYTLACDTGADFRLMGVPQEVPITTNPISPDPQAMRSLFEEGRKCGQINGPWSSLPPGVSPTEWLQPRGGVRFVTKSSE